MPAHFFPDPGKSQTSATPHHGRTTRTSMPAAFARRTAFHVPRDPAVGNANIKSPPAATIRAFRRGPAPGQKSGNMPRWCTSPRRFTTR